MLKSLTARQFMEWMIYDKIEPFGDLRADWHAAQIVTMLAEIARDRVARPEPFELTDFVLSFNPQPKKQKQTWQEQKKILTSWALAFRTTEQIDNID